MPSRAWRRASPWLAATACVALVALGRRPTGRRRPRVPPLRRSLVDRALPRATRPRTRCDPTDKPGPQAVRGLIQADVRVAVVRTSPARAPGRRPATTTRGGPSTGGATPPTPTSGTPGRHFIAWLLATDQYGNAHAMAGASGSSYIIWNTQMFRMYDVARGWQPYTGSSPHTDHVHISFSWAGAWARTSFYTGVPLWGMSVDRSEIEAFIDAAYLDFVGSLAGQHHAIGLGDAVPQRVARPLLVRLRLARTPSTSRAWWTSSTGTPSVATRTRRRRPSGARPCWQA